MRAAPNQRLLSPSFKALHSSVVPDGTPCAMDRCRCIKSSVKPLYGLQVLRDTDVGNESYGWIFFCAPHAKMYASLFKSPFIVPLSSVRVFMLEGTHKVDISLSSSSLLDKYLRRASQSAQIGTAANRRSKLAKHSSRLAKKRKKAQESNTRDIEDGAAARGYTVTLGGGED
jgi:hypothetical protein